MPGEGNVNRQSHDEGDCRRHESIYSIQTFLRALTRQAYHSCMYIVVCAIGYRLLDWGEHGYKQNKQAAGRCPPHTDATAGLGRCCDANQENAGVLSRCNDLLFYCNYPVLCKLDLDQDRD